MLKNSIQDVYKRLESQRKVILSQYDQLTPDQRQFKPGPDKWNLLQIIRHIIIAEKQSLIYIRRKSAAHNEISDSGIGAVIRTFLLKFALWLPIKFKAPKIAQVDEDYPDYSSMKIEWDSVRADLQTIIEEYDEQKLKKEIYKHPKAGKMNLKQALEFFESHISHHQRQIDRIMRNPKFPR